MKPLFTLSKSIVHTQYNKVKQACDIVSYSSKTNPLITPILEKETDSMFSIHLINELKNVEDTSRIFFLAQAWDDTLIQNLFNKGIRWFAVDNETDLGVFLDWIKKNSITEKMTLFFRLMLQENTLRTEKFFVFGMKSEVITTKIKEINESNIFSNLKLGIHFHRKTQNMAEWNYTYEISQLFSAEIFEKISYINMGGGLPSNYANTNVHVINSIFSKIQEFKEFCEKYFIELVIEPGRFIAAPSATLSTTIIGKHGNNLIVNASVYNTDMDALIVPVKLLVIGELPKEDPKSEAYVIKGVTPCSMDLFRYRVYLDNHRIGDEIIFKNAGAYNFKTEFCNLEKIETRVIE